MTHHKSCYNHDQLSISMKAQTGDQTNSYIEFKSNHMTWSALSESRNLLPLRMRWETNPDHPVQSEKLENIMISSGEENWIEQSDLHPWNPVDSDLGVQSRISIFQWHIS
jgi:hypothetical protein